jgi:thiol-disulfide isomerase/thioredoxin
MRLGTLLSAAVGVGVALHVAPAGAQCTTCSPLSLPSGSLVGQDLDAARRSTWSVLAQTTSGWVGFPQQVADNRPIETRSSARYDLFLTTVQASALHRSGLGVDTTLPFGWLATRVGEERRQDFSLGDAEIKPRATTILARSVRLTGVAGAALPTGSYTARSGAGALGDSARSLTIGRGVFWGVAEVEGRVEATRALSFTTSAQGRLPLGEASDGFRWGPELRGNGEVEVRPVPALGLAAGGELQLRGSGSIIDPFLGERVPSTNVGATIVSVTPSVRVNLPSGLFGSVTGRIPVYQDLVGLQFRQGPGAFVGLGYVFPVGAPASAPPPATETGRYAAAETRSGRFLVREYGADWCDACRRLEPVLAASRQARADVRFEKVDVTDWSEGELARRVPGAKGLPIVEVRRGDGTLVARLEGAAAFSFARHLPDRAETRVAASR